MSSFPNDPRKNPGIKRAFYPLPVEDPDDWRCIEVHIPNGEEYHELLITALKSLTIWFNYQRDATHRGKVIADRFAYALMLPELGCEMNCEELTACLQPLFDSLTASQDAQTATLEQLKYLIEQSLAANSAQPQSQESDCDDAENIYAGCLGLVDKFHEDNEALYARAEELPADNAEEWAGIIVGFFPNFAALPFGAMLELSNQHFNTAATAYSDAFTPIREEMAFRLYCRITDNDCTLNQDIIGAWLEGLPAQFPGNAAAALFGKYSPTRQTFLNQIAAFFNQNQSLQSYFADLITAYNYGHENTEEIPGGFDCDESAFSVLARPDPTEEPPGQDSGFDVSLGTEYHILAVGVWTGGFASFGADGWTGHSQFDLVLPSGTTFQMIFRIGSSGAWQQAGSDVTFTADDDGRLYFAMNDAIGAYTDNSGSIAVTISET